MRQYGSLSLRKVIDVKKGQRVVQVSSEAPVRTVTGAVHKPRYEV